MHTLSNCRFALAWLLPVGVGVAAWISPWAAWGAMAAWQLALAVAERVPSLRHSPAPVPATAWHRACLRVHVPLQAVLLALGLAIAPSSSWGGVLALALGVGGVAGSQGITFAHELGHARSKLDRLLAWLLMGSVNYAHFMVEHYRGHHVRAATADDPATARRGESLWCFLPRTLAGSWRSAWRLEAHRLCQRQRPAWRSPLLLATSLQALWLAVLATAFGPKTLVFWLLQSAYAVFLLEAINYIEHYGLQRAPGQPLGVQHAWNADAVMTNCVVANLQRHSDHHLHAWKPYPTLEALPGPQLPTGYAGCLFIASVPRLWFRTLHPRLPV